MKRLVMLGVLGVAEVVGACSSGAQGPTGAQGPAGMNGTDGTNGEAGPPGSSQPASPSVSGITPPQSFLARTTELTISGYGTNWSGTTMVSFGGTDIKVNKITVASPTAMVVNITTDKAAVTGPRDVTVTDGTSTETYKGAFQVLSPIAMTFQGTQAQGSLVLASVKVLDTSTPLDTTADITGAFTNLALTTPAGVTGQVVAASDFSATIEFFIDVPTTAGTLDLGLVSGPAGDPTDVDFPAPKSFTVAARTPTPIMAGAAATMGNTAAIYATSLYAYTPTAAALSIVDFTVSTTSSTATPALIVLPSDGKWADEVASGQAMGAPATFSWLTSATTPLYGITFDNSGATGPYSVAVASTAAAANAATTTTDGTKATAITASALPFVLTGGDLSKGTGQDWVKVTTTTANATLHLQTVGNPSTDTAIAVYASNGTTQVGTTIDTGTVADGEVQLTTAGVYYVVFSQGGQYDGVDSTYEGIIRSP